MKNPESFIKDRFAAIKADILNSPGDNPTQKATVAYEQFVYEKSICRGAIFYARHTDQINDLEEKQAIEYLVTEETDLTKFITQTLPD